MIVTQDDQLISTLSRVDFAPTIATLGLQRLLSYSHSEPQVTTITSKGSASHEDPVSGILQPTKVGHFKFLNHSRTMETEFNSQSAIFPSGETSRNRLNTKCTLGLHSNCWIQRQLHTSRGDEFYPFTLQADGGLNQGCFIISIGNMSNSVRNAC